MEILANFTTLFTHLVAWLENRVVFYSNRCGLRSFLYGDSAFNGVFFGRIVLFYFLLLNGWSKVYFVGGRYRHLCFRFCRSGRCFIGSLFRSFEGCFGRIVVKRHRCEVGERAVDEFAQSSVGGEANLVVSADLEALAGVDVHAFTLTDLH